MVLTALDASTTAGVSAAAIGLLALGRGRLAGTAPLAPLTALLTDEEQPPVPVRLSPFGEQLVRRLKGVPE
jgi:branched-chain amino acid transport system permease protein